MRFPAIDLEVEGEIKLYSEQYGHPPRGILLGLVEYYCLIQILSARDPEIFGRKRNFDYIKVGSVRVYPKRSPGLDILLDTASWEREYLTGPNKS